jgi:hypothetical protein
MLLKSGPRRGGDLYVGTRFVIFATSLHLFNCFNFRASFSNSWQRKTIQLWPRNRRCCLIFLLSCARGKWHHRFIFQALSSKSTSRMITDMRLAMRDVRLLLLWMIERSPASRNAHGGIPHTSPSGAQHRCPSTSAVTTWMYKKRRADFFLHKCIVLGAQSQHCLHHLLHHQQMPNTLKSSQCNQHRLGHILHPIRNQYTY